MSALVSQVFVLGGNQIPDHFLVKSVGVSFGVQKSAIFSVQ